MVTRFFLFFFFWFLPSISFSNTCANLFNTSVRAFPNQRQDIKSRLQNILINENLIAHIDIVRRQYDNKSLDDRMGATIHYLTILEKYGDLPYEKDINPLEAKVIEQGFDMLTRDLTQISPRYISTDRMLRENVALVVAMLAREYAKEKMPETFDKVISLTSQTIKYNSDYINSRRSMLNIIGSYANQSYIPKLILHNRVDEMLLVDLRYQMLAAEQKFTLTDRIVKSLEDVENIDIETMLERFFARPDKVRIK